ncbi:hypothetical protein [Streptomyces sp. Wb2n-11]|uniref:hypothetical protein n=1 Tax=Streptomyces sp. Wb2n-11 TaxID=1030533 RepID=UPI000B03023A|nr:hypothetical protein [Streptomyces sp. Wb2n-11]
MTTALRQPRLLPVPAVALWSYQKVRTPSLRIGPDGIYHEGTENRDEEGQLWPQVRGSQTGAPQYAVMNPLKQRQAMKRLLCQVGMGPATRTEYGVLWVLPRPTGSPEDPEYDWDQGVTTTEPPVCRFHARVSAYQCPRLRTRGHVAVFVREAELVAVEGTYYPPPSIGVRPIKTALPIDSPDTRLMVADRLVRRLRATTPVDLTDRILARGALPCTRRTPAKSR